MKRDTRVATLYTANQETEGFGRLAVRQRGYGLRLLIFKMANNKVDLGQIRSEENRSR